MVELRLFGGAVLVGEQGQVLGRSAQRRRLALLALLAVARRPVTRDKVIGFLWPERDTESARRLLSESLYVLRKALGEDAILTKGDDLQLNADVVRTDVAAFEDALGRGDRAQAVDLYQGDFLDGFFIDEAAEFSHWADVERERFARARKEALEVLAAEALSAGDGRAAVGWWRRLAAADPYSARIALGLMGALEATGDRAGALQHARIHAALLEREFEAEPDPDVEAYAERLRAAPAEAPLAAPRATTAAAAQPVETAGPPVPGPAGQPAETAGPPLPGPAAEPHPQTVPDAPTAPQGKRDSEAWRRLAIRTAAAVLVFALVVWGWFATRTRIPAPATPADVTLWAVFPCTVNAESDDPALRGVDILLTSNLDGVGNLRTIGTRTLMTALSPSADAGSLAPDRAGAIARDFGADSFVLCDVFERAGRLRIDARPYGDASGEEHLVTADGTDLFNVAEELTIKLAMAALDDPSIASERARRLMTRSLPAFRRFVEGEDLFLDARYQEAMRAFAEATDADSSFALAWYRLSMAREFGFDFLGARFAIEHAVRQFERLPESDRELVTAWDHFLAGRISEAENRYHVILSRQGGDVDALSGLAEVLAHYNPVRGRSTTEAKLYLDSLLRVAPRYGEARLHRLELAAMEGDSATFHQLVTGVDPSTPHALAWEAVRVFRWGTPAEKDRIMDRLNGADEVSVMFAVGRTGAHLHDFESAWRATNALLTERRTSNWRAAALLLRAETAVARGQFERARAELARAAQIEPAWSLELGTLIALFPDAGSDREFLLALRDSVAAWEPQERDPNTEAFFFLPHADVHKALRLYLLGLLSARLGDHSDAEARRAEVSRWTLPTPAFARELAASIRARVLLARADSGTALEVLRGAPVQGPLERIIASPFFSRPHDRMLMAELLEARGQVFQADSIYASLLEGFDAMFAGPVHLRRARLHERLGDGARAALYYDRFAELWSAADSTLQYLVTDARKRAELLAGRGS